MALTIAGAVSIPVQAQTQAQLTPAAGNIETLPEAYVLNYGSGITSITQDETKYAWLEVRNMGYENPIKSVGMEVSIDQTTGIVSLVNPRKGNADFNDVVDLCVRRGLFYDVTLNIPEGMFSITNGGNTVTNDLQTVEYKVNYPTEKYYVGLRVTTPETSVISALPTSYSVTFSTQGLTLDNIQYAGNYTTVKGDDNTTVYEGTYAYLQARRHGSSTPVNSSPLSCEISDTGAVTFTYKATAKEEFKTFVSDLEKNGEFYTLDLIMPEGLFKIVGTNTSNVVLPITNRETVSSFIYNGTWTAANIASTDPADKGSVDSLSEIKVTFGSDAACTASALTAQVEMKSGIDSWLPVGTLAASAEGVNGILKAATPFTDKGQYRVTMPTGLFTFENGTSKSYSLENVITIAVGEAYNNNVTKSEAVLSSTPAEGTIDLVIFPAGVGYMNYVFTRGIEINRDFQEPVVLKRDGEQIATVKASNDYIFRLSSQRDSDGNETYNTIDIWFDPNAGYISAPGKYTVEFPDGIITMDGKPVTDLVFTYNINRQLNYQMIPPHDIPLDQIKNVSILFQEAESVRINPDNKSKISIAGISPEITIEGRLAMLDFGAITTGGVYNWTVPEGYFLATIDGKEYPNQPMSIQYIVSASKPEIDPAEGVLPSNIVTRFALILPDDQYIQSVHTYATFTRLCPVLPDGTIDYSNYTYFVPSAPIPGRDPDKYDPEHCVFLSPASGSVTLSPGNYALVTAAHIYTLEDGTDPRENTYYFTVLPNLPESGKPDINPAEGQTLRLTTFDISLPQGTQILNISKDDSYIYPLLEDGSYGDAVVTLQGIYGQTPNVVTLMATSKEKEIPYGYYVLVTPAKMYYTAENVAASYTFKFKYVEKVGVDDLAAEEPETVTVYTMTGICLLRDADRSALANLEKGLYIINGKKVVIL